jgi:hypothetical protein
MVQDAPISAGFGRPAPNNDLEWLKLVDRSTYTLFLRKKGVYSFRSLYEGHFSHDFGDCLCTHLIDFTAFADPFWKAKDRRWSIPGGTVSGSDFGSPLKGVSSEKMSVESFGESKPLMDQRKRLGTSGQSTVEINIKEGQ